MAINLKTFATEQMAETSERINGHDPSFDHVVTSEGYAPTDDDLELNPTDNNLGNAILDEFQSVSRPYPVCTSTPTVWKPQFDVFSSTVACPSLRLDFTTDSGLGDTFHSTPSLSATDSPFSDITDVISPSVGVSDCKTDGGDSSDVCLRSSPVLEFRTRSMRHKFASVHERISSTPISQAFLGRPLVSAEIARSSNTTSPICQPLPSTNSFHVESGDSEEIRNILALHKNERESDGEVSDESSMSFENEFQSGSPSFGGLDGDGTSASISNVSPQFNSTRTCTEKQDAQVLHCSIQRSKKNSEDEASMLSENECESACSVETANQPQGRSRDLAERFDTILKVFSPPVPDRLIGRYIGEEYFDIFVCLHDRMIPACGIINWLGQYLMPIDFLRMCGVCKRWRQICLEDVHIAKYHKLCARLHGDPADKENYKAAKLKLPSSAGVTFTRSLHLLGEVQQAVSVTNSTASNAFTSKSTLYDKIRPTLKWGDMLRHCPFCNSVSKIVEGEDRGMCQNQTCKADFCTRCRTPYHPHLPCREVVRWGSVDKVCGKKSKKILKRIAHLSDIP